MKPTPIRLLILSLFLSSLAACSGDNSGTGTASQGIPVSSAEEGTLLMTTSSPLPEKEGWSDILIDPTGEYVYPTNVIPEGDPAQIDNPELLKAADGKCATIKSNAPLLELNSNRLVIDLGINTGGVVEVGFCDGSTASTHLAFAERRIWLNNDGDYTGDNAGQDDDPEGRSHDIAARTKGNYVVPGIQGGQRWVLLALGSSGVAKIDYVRVKPTHLRVSTPTQKGIGYSGRFLSSDPLLNTIWSHSAYTMSMTALKDPQRERFVYVDGAKRDRMVWLGDVGNQGLAAYYSHKDGRKIMRDTLAMFGCQQYPSGYLPMFSQIYVTCKEDFSDLAPDGPVPHALEPQEEIGRLGEYTAWWVIGLADYYLYSGDKTFVKAMLPVARRTMNYFESRSNKGLYCTGQIGSDTPSPALVAAAGPLGTILTQLFDTFSLIGKSTGACIPAYVGEISWQPFDIASGETMHTNAVIYRSYKRLAELERELGMGDEAAKKIEKLAEERRLAMVKAFWDEPAGAFTGNTFNPQTNHTQDGNVEALLGGIVKGPQAARVLNFMDAKLQGPYGTYTGVLENDPFMQKLYAPFIGSRELVARLDNLDTKGALNLLRKMWGHMTVADPASTLWERVGINGEIPAYNLKIDPLGKPSLQRPNEGFTSAAHGWGAGPINALTGYIVGIRPVKPGYSEWLIEPQLGDLTWAQGRADSPFGVFESRWEVSDSGFKMTVVSPEGTQGKVSVPLKGADRMVAMNGKVIWANGAAAPGMSVVKKGDYLVISNVTGSNTIAW